MGNSKKKNDKKKKGGAGKALFALVVLVGVAGGAMYAFAPDTLQQGLQYVGLDIMR